MTRASHKIIYNDNLFLTAGHEYNLLDSGAQFDRGLTHNLKSEACTSQWKSTCYNPKASGLHDHQTKSG